MCKPTQEEMRERVVLQVAGPAFVVLLRELPIRTAVLDQAELLRQ